MLNSHLVLLRRYSGKFLFTCNYGRQEFYSRRSGSNQPTFKIVVKQSDSVDDFSNSSVGIDSNWELLNPHGYRFFLPGNVGLAWTEPSSTIGTKKQFSGTKYLDLDCNVQECPMLLRQGIADLFPGADFGTEALSIVTLTQKISTDKKSQKISVQKLEKITKLFVITASEICVKLKTAGYWADFINPFSGLPYLNPFYNSKQEIDKQLPVNGYRITEKNHCRVIDNNGPKNVIGSIFTTAPTNQCWSAVKFSLEDFEE